MRRALIFVVAAACWRGEPPRAADVAGLPEPVGEKHGAFVIIDMLAGNLDEDAARRAVTDALQPCARVRATPITGDFDFVAVGDGTIASSSAQFADNITNECIKRALARMHVEPSPVPRRGAAVRGVTLAAGPAGCTTLYRIGDRVRACVTAAAIDVVEVGRGSISKLARRRVLDASGEAIVVDGPCDAKDEYNVENAVCVVERGTFVVYVGAKTAAQPGFPRGIVRPQGGGIIATNGLVIARSEDSNKDTTPDGDVQAELAEAGLRPASCPRWTVRVPLHRERERFVMTFADCENRWVDVELVLADGTFRWRRR